MKKRIISMLLVLAMAVSFAPQWILGANAAESAVTNGENAYDSMSEAVAAATEGDTLMLHADLSEDVTIDKDIYLDLNGFNLDGMLTVADGVIVYGLDSQTNDGTIEDENGYGSITEFTGDLLADSGYAMIQGASGYSFHFADMQITHMTLRAEDAAVYYKSYFAGDEVLAENADTYGIAMSIEGIPDAENIASCPASKYGEFESGAINSTLLHNIINAENTLEENIYRAELDVYARAYVRMADGQYILGEHAQRSLREQVEGADYIWGELTDEQRTALREMYEQFGDVMTEWTIPNITAPETPDVDLPAEDGAVVSIVDAIAAGDAMSQDTFTTNKYKITGVVDEIYNATYGNMYIKDTEGNRLKIYGTYDATGEIRYDALTVKPAVGDKVVLLGVIGNYNGAQMKNGWIVEHTPAEGTTPDTPDEPELGVSYVDAPVAGTAYKFVMNQAGLGKMLGFTGQMGNTYYFGTSEDIAEMVDVYLEEATGGYHIYFMNGSTKTYLNVIPRSNDATKTNVVMQTLAENAAPSVYELNTEFKYVKTACVGTDWYLGTYGTNTTISASKTSYISDTSTIGVSQFVTWFATAGAAENPDTPDTPDVPEDPKPEEPAEGISYVDAPVAGTAYKFVMNQAGLGKMLGFTGKMGNTYYFGTSEDAAEMVDVYLEEATGGYHIYFMNGSAKTYLNVIPRSNDATKTNVVMQTLEENAAPSVYELNTEFKYVKTACVGTDWYLGTYGSNTTISASKTSYIEDTSTIGVSQFVTWFATGGTTPDTPEDDTDVIVLTVAEALAMAQAMEADQYTTIKYKVTGVIDTITSAKYGNMSIKGEDGSVFGVYGTWNADGSTRFGDMSEKPGEGSTVTLLGIIGNYQGNTPQMKDGWILEFTAAPEAETPTNAFTYDFSTFSGTSTQYAEETHDLGSGVSLSVVKCHVNQQLRIYSSTTNNGVAIFQTGSVISSVKFSAGYKDDVLNVYGSVDGETWTLVKAEAVTTAYGNHTIEMPAGTSYKYLKLDVEGANQVRIANITINFAG